MEFRRQQLAEEDARRAELNANAAGQPIVVSAPVTDASTNTNVQSKSVTVPQSPGKTGGSIHIGSEALF
jgi:hypothetical protein